MQRHIDELTEKALTHTVYGNKDKDRFVVDSGTSHDSYRVTAHPNGLSYNCSCTWQFHNPGSECSHVLAVRMFLR